VNGSRSIADATIGKIETAAARSALYLSIIAIWEIAMLVRKQRIVLGKPIREWIEQALANPGITLAALTLDVAIESNELPGDMHGDPVDRIMIATARSLNAALVTRDRLILAYGARRHVKVLPA
jgi:PIN domain nuclease of toxin-antitoxin system